MLRQDEGEQSGLGEAMNNWSLVVVATIMAVWSTVWPMNDQFRVVVFWIERFFQFFQFADLR